MAPRQLTRTFLPLLAAVAVLASFVPAAVAQPLSFGGDAERAKVKRAALNVSALRPGDRAMLAVELEIKPGFHAQSRTPSQEFLIKFDIKPDENPALSFGEPVFPKGHDEEYPGLGKLNVYTGNVVVRVPVEVKADAKPGDVTITGKLNYQICDDKVCYAPESPKFEIKSKVTPPGSEVKPNEPELFKGEGSAEPATGDKPPTTAATAPSGAPAVGAAPPVVIEQEGADRGAVTWFAIAFLAGILFNIVPCVLPVLPIKVLGFAEVAEHNRGKTVLLATVFGLGIVTVFAVLATLILVLRTITWGEQFSNPLFAWGVVVLLLVLSLWLFGVLNFNLPAKAYGFTPRHDTYFGNYLWGILTAVLSTPCTGPLFPPLMLWAQQQPTAVGVPAFMMVGVGMAFPYVVLSAFPETARRFPRVGPWSELFKQMLGFILLGFTVWFAAGRFTSAAGQWWATVPVAAMAALYLMARTVQLSSTARAVGISSAVAVALVTTSVLVACRFSGVFDPRPVATGGGADAAAVAWTPYSDEALAAARGAGKTVLVKFTANWCLNCQYVEATVFHDAEAINALRKHGVVTLKADLTANDAPGWPRLRELSATGGIPLTAIYVPAYEKPVQISSVYTTATLVKTLDQLSATKAVATR